MKPESYPAARIVAPKLHDYFACRRETAQVDGRRDLACLPDTETIAAIIDAAFWASLRREEGSPPRISLAYVLPGESPHPLLLERPLELGPGALTRVAPAVERPGLHLGVLREGDRLSVWGATRGIPLLCFVLEVAAPGLLVIKHHNGEETRKFINVAVLEGDQIKFVEDRGRPDAPPLLKSLLQLESPESGAQSVMTLLELAVSMREHGHGGLLLIVPSGSDSWRSSTLQPMQYAVSPPFRELAQFKAQMQGEAVPGWWKDSARPAIAAIGGLTAVDGAVVLNNRYELLGFGAKIVRRTGSPRVEQMTLTEPIRGATPTLVHPEQLGGTRHLSAAQFVHDQRDAVALVASQDGRFTVFEWSPRENNVHAYQIETLLL
jgi:hypothetical protein